MDPISAAASIVGLVGAAAKVSESLFKFIRSVKEAPKLASTVLQEVSDISACLSQLQNFLMGTKAASRSHENLLMLEKIVEALKPSDPMQPGRLAQWILKEQTIKTLFTRLQYSKVSLNLMMTILTCASVGEAQASASELATLVTQVLESNQEMSRRMARIEQRIGRSPSTIPTITGIDAISSPSVVETNTTEDNNSVVTIKGLTSGSQNATNDEPIRIFGFSFDQDLNTSRPYTRALKRHSVWSTASSEIHTMGWSFLSGLSLAEVSQISVINLPIFLHDLWNGQHYSASRIEDSRVGLVLSKSHSYSSSSPTTQPAPTPKRRLKIRNSVANRKISLLGLPSSGKTTIFNHLQILYGNGITKVERLVAFGFTVGNMIHMFTEAWSNWYDQYGQENDKEHFQTLIDTTADDLTNEFVIGSCQRALRHLWNNQGVRDTILDWSTPMFDDNVPYYMENLEQLFPPHQIVSDSIFLRHSHPGDGVYEQRIDIDGSQYQIIDPSARCKWVHCLHDGNIVIFVVSLTSYYQPSPNNMMNSLDAFAALTKQEQLKSTPFIVLLNKFDLFEEKIRLEPVHDYFPSYSGGPDSSLACSYFASEFLKLDERPNASLRIYRTSAVDRDSLKATMDSIAQTMPRTSI